MPSHIVLDVNRNPHRRSFVTGRTAKDPETKYVQQGLKLPPGLKRYVAQWKQVTGKSYAAWVRDEMYKAVAIYTETV